MSLLTEPSVPENPKTTQLGLWGFNKKKLRKVCPKLCEEGFHLGPRFLVGFANVDMYDTPEQCFLANMIVNYQIWGIGKAGYTFEEWYQEIVDTILL